MKPLGIAFLGLATISGANAAILTYSLTYTDLAGGPSFGTGVVTIDSSVLIPDTSNFTTTPSSIIDSFGVTFFNFPNNGPITFDLSNLGAVYLLTGPSDSIDDFNFWTYVPNGSNTCPTCTVPYLSGVASFVGTVTDPVHGNTVVTYGISVTEVPELKTFWMVLFCSLLGACSMWTATNRIRSADRGHRTPGRPPHSQAV